MTGVEIGSPTDSTINMRVQSNQAGISQQVHHARRRPAGESPTTQGTGSTPPQAKTLEARHSEAQDKLATRFENAISKAPEGASTRQTRVAATQASQALEARFQNALQGGPSSDAAAPMSLSERFDQAVGSLKQRGLNALEGAQSQEQARSIRVGFTQARNALDNRLANATNGTGGAPGAGGPTATASLRDAVGAIESAFGGAPDVGNTTQAPQTLEQAFQSAISGLENRLENALAGAGDSDARRVLIQQATEVRDELLQRFENASGGGASDPVATQRTLLDSAGSTPLGATEPGSSGITEATIRERLGEVTSQLTERFQNALASADNGGDARMVTERYEAAKASLENRASNALGQLGSSGADLLEALNARGHTGHQQV